MHPALIKDHRVEMLAAARAEVSERKTELEHARLQSNLRAIPSFVKIVDLFTNGKTIG